MDRNGLILTAIEEHLDGLLSNMEALSAQMGISDAPAAVDAPTRRLRAVLLAAFPGLLFVGTCSRGRDTC